MAIDIMGSSLANLDLSGLKNSQLLRDIASPQGQENYLNWLKESDPTLYRNTVVENLKSQILNQWKQIGVPSIGGGIPIEQRAASLADRLYANKITDISKLRLGTGTRKTQVPSGEEYGQAFVEGEEPASFLQYEGRQIGFLGNADDGGRNWDPSGYLQPGNLVSWTASGKGAVGYTAQAAPNGQVYFVPSWGSTSDVSKVAPIVGLGLMLVPGLQGLGASVGAAVAGGASAATQLVIGNALVQGAIAEATGGDFVKGAVAGAVGASASGVSSAVSNAVGGGVAGAAAGQAVTSGLTAAVTGGDVGKAIVQGAVSGAVNYVPPAQGMNSQLTPAQIESGLGTEGYGTGAAAQASGLFDPSKVGSGAYVQPPLSGDYSVKPDYSLFPGSKTPSLSDMGGAQGVQEPTLPKALDSKDTVDYSLAPQTGGEPSLQMPKAPNLESMAGGKGITVPVDGGTMTESGLISDKYTPDLGDTTSFINQPAPGEDVSDVVNQAISNVEAMPPSDSKLSAKDAAKFLRAVMGFAATGTVVDQILSTPGTTKVPTLNYGDIYKDAPIKGFSMQKMQDEFGATKYMPKISQKELLDFEDSFKPVAMAKGGFVKRRS